VERHRLVFDGLEQPGAGQRVFDGPSRRPRRLVDQRDEVEL